MRSLIVVLAVALAGLAVLAAVVVLAMGKGGELAEVSPDHPPLPGDRPISDLDVALLRLPRGLWGYHVDVTNEVLRRVARALAEREMRVAVLERQLAELRSATDAPDQSRGETPWAAPLPPQMPYPVPAPSPPVHAPAPAPAQVPVPADPPPLFGHAPAEPPLFEPPNRPSAPPQPPPPPGEREPEQ